MADVASRAGVSISTVSRALRGLPGVGRQTRERILAIAEEMAYVVSPEASGLSRRATGRVAVVVPRLDSWFSATILAAIEATVRAADLDVMVYQVDGERARARFFHELPTRRKVDAVVLVSLPLLPNEEQRLDLMGVRTVVAGGRLRDLPYVEVDDAEIGRTAVDHLVALGHRRIAMIRTSDTDGARWNSDVNRVRGWSEALAGHGLGPDPRLLVTEQYDVRAGARGIDQLLELDPLPTAVFCYSDDIAVAAQHRLERRGLRVPDDVSLVGVDGNPLTGLFEITTVDQQVPEQGRRAATMALDLLADRTPDDPAQCVESRLVARASTASPPAALLRGGGGQTGPGGTTV
jgi:LacI family repressor for deo operon, udp, cdd, tsx, nupC, and nupG